MRRDHRAEKFLLLPVSFCLLAAAVVFPARSAQERPKPGGVLRIRPFSDDARPNLDPASGAWAFAKEQIYDGLVTLDAKLAPVPDLAEYWITEEDGRRTIFYLRKGSVFHNGRAVTSEDVKFSFERILRPETGSPFSGYFVSHVAGALEFAEGKAREVAGFKTIAPDVFEIEWTSPFVSALPLLAMSFAKVLPRDLVRDQGRNFFYRPVGTGPFAFDSWLRSPQLEIVGVRLARNPRYFFQPPYVDLLEISPFFTDEHFRDRDLDICPFRSEDLAEAGCKVVPSGPRSLTLLAMSCATPPLDRPSVRRAIASALDRDALAKSGERLDVVQRAAGSFIPPLWPEFFPRDAEAPSPEKSRRVLEDQGFFVEKAFPTLALYIPAGRNNREHQLFAREVARELGSIGIAVSIRTYQTLGDLEEVRQPFLVKIDWSMDIPDPEAVLRSLFHSHSETGRFVTRYSRPDLDKLLDEARAEKSAGRRNDLFHKAEEIVLEDLPAVPVTMGEQRLAVQPYVHGVRLPPLGFAHLDVRSIWLDKKDAPR
jgi:ABC-type transport system substrate-binding protein